MCVMVLFESIKPEIYSHSSISEPMFTIYRPTWTMYWLTANKQTPHNNKDLRVLSKLDDLSYRWSSAMQKVLYLLLDAADDVTHKFMRLLFLNQYFLPKFQKSRQESSSFSACMWTQHTVVNKSVDTSSVGFA